MKIFGIGVFAVFAVSAALLGTACTDDTDEMATDAAVKDGAVVSDGNTSVDVKVTDAKATDAAGDAQILKAKATLASVGGSTTTGTILFTQTGGSVIVALTVSGATPGQHGFHIHVNASCENSLTQVDAGVDAGVIVAGGAGGHFNPTNMMHGSLVADGGMHHAGDFGNVTVNADGNGSKSLTTTEWTVGGVGGRS